MLVHVPAKSGCRIMRRSSGTGLPIFRCLVASFPLLVPWLSAAPSFAEVPDCLVVEAHAAPSGDGRYDHSLTFINGCTVRMYLTTRYSDASDSTARHHLLATGDTVTITLGYSQPTKAFRAQYEGRFARRSEGRSSNDRVTGTVRAAASRAETGSGVETRSHAETRSRAETPPRSVGSSGPPGSSLSLVELCRRAMRKIVTLEGLSENDSMLKDLVATCPARVSKDPEKRRAELECVLKTSPREDVGICFGAN